eukprot:TRINITY_DN10193_c0_g1_i1.p1 TRINITY_DN10193_c0_g1~~TRINITY_DN10193_c0_g1_i1.p1  ORF type:complete len:266 (+),score=50.00 TRINITY_DN10193_c0_g1_i1:113-910(+)
MSYRYSPLPQTPQSYQNTEIEFIPSAMTSTRPLLASELGSDIAELEKRNVKLDRMLGKIGMKGDDQSLRAALDEEHESAKLLCKKIIDELKYQQQNSDKRNFQRLANQFQTALERFKQLHASFEQKEQRIVKTYSDAHPSYQGNDDALERGEQDQQQDSQSQVQFTDYDIDDIQKRRDQIVQLERDTGEVAEMFRDLATMVNEQGQVLDQIADNIGNSKTLVSAGHEELVSAEDYQIRARKRKCCLLFTVLGVAGVIVVLYMLLK